MLNKAKRRAPYPRVKRLHQAANDLPVIWLAAPFVFHLP